MMKFKLFEFGRSRGGGWFVAFCALHRNRRYWPLLEFGHSRLDTGEEGEFYVNCIFFRTESIWTNGKRTAKHLVFDWHGGWL